MMEGIYTGRVRELKGQVALLRDTAKETKIIAQFKDLSLPQEHTHGWKAYPAGQFKVISGAS